MKQLLAISLLLGGAGAAQAQDLTNNGATLTLTNGAVLSVAGGLSNSSGTLDLSNGANQLYVGGNLVNASGATLTPGTASTVTLNGAATQQLDLNGAGLANLTVNSSSGVALPAGSNADVAGALTLSSGMVTTAPSATLRLLNGATLSGETSTRYVAGNLAAVKANVPGGAATALPNSFTLTPSATITNLTVTRTAGLNTPQVSQGTNAGGTNEGIDRIWRTSAPLTNTQVVLGWVSANDNGLTSSLANAQVWARSAAPVAGSGWARISNAQNGTGRSATGTVPTAASLSFFTVSTAAAPLPVTLTTFAAQAEGPATVRLRWATASEQDNAGFTVERSRDGHSFGAIGTVPGAGTSSTPRDYALLDEKLPAGATLLYYRLRQTDFGGAETYSAVRTVALTPQAAGFVVYPTRVAIGQPATYLYTGPAGPATLEVLDLLGRTLRTVRTADAAQGPVPLADLASGSYLLRYTTAFNHFTTRCVVE